MRHQGKEVIALGISMAKGGDIIALGKSLRAATAEIDKRPAGGHASWRRCRTSRWRSRPRSTSSCGVLIEAVAIVLAVSFIALGLHKGGRFGVDYIDIRPGAGGGASRSRWCWP